MVSSLKSVSEPRMSIFRRDIKTLITRDELKKRVDRSEKGKLKRLENKLNREEGIDERSCEKSTISHSECEHPI